MNATMHEQLARVNRTVNLWKAERLLLLWGAAWGAVLCVLSLSDFLLRYAPPGRLAAWIVLMCLSGTAVLFLLLALFRRRTNNAIAAMLEHGFPQLDNHIINYVQLESENDVSPLRQAYLKRGIPEWNAIDLRGLRNRRAYLRGYGVAIVVALLLVAPFFWVGTAWPTAMLRILNPFSSRLPATLATLISVQPGDISVVRGDPLILSCQARGYSGQKVALDLWPTDDARSSVLIGVLSGQGTSSFSYRIPKINADIAYRIRVGDAMPSTRFKITAIAPLAIQSLKIRITPPGYTKLSAGETNGLTAHLSVPQHSRVEFKMRCNRKLAQCSLALEPASAMALESFDGGNAWNGGWLVSSGGLFRLTAVDLYGVTITNDLPFDLISDKSPAIRVVAPTAKTILTVASTPVIQFEVNDDFGLARLALQRVTPERALPADDDSNTIQTWPVTGLQSFAGEWRGDLPDNAQGMVFRLVATDNMQPGPPHRAESAPIVFEKAPVVEVMQQKKQTSAAATVSLAKLVEMQRANLNTTISLNVAPGNATVAQWNAALSVQTEIRQTALSLLRDVQRPLGTLSLTLKLAFDGPMLQAIDLLDRVAKAETEARDSLAKNAIQQETAILRMLSQIEVGLNKVQQHQTETGLLALLDALVKGQQDTLARTRAAVTTGAVSKPLVKRQDALANDTAEFVRMCRGEKPSQETSQAEFGKLAQQAAALAESKRIRADMLTAGELLEANRMTNAIPPQARALDGLQEIQKMLNAWRAQDAQQKTEQLRELVENAKATLSKLSAVQTKVVKAIRATETQKNQSTNATAALTLENQELKAAMEEAALKLANDLQALPELPALNQLVNDVSQIFEVMKQIAGSDKIKATELGLQKEDWLAEGLGKAMGKVDEMEMWLASKPDAVKRNTETFDKQELPVIAKVTLGAPLEDIIGDLQKQAEDIKKDADDSTGNQATPDIPPGWAVAEGETTDYGAKGKSGNEAPEHKDQDGRSNVGRQGMSDGEIAAGSGKINEGDKNIEKRMTRDASQGGEVKEDDHVKAKATGGGKLSGFGEETGMSGAGPRRDSSDQEASELGKQARLRRQADAVYAQATIQHLRTGSMDKVLQHMRQAEDALNKHLPLAQVREFQRRAIVSLKQTRAELDGGFAGELPAEEQADRTVDDQVASTSDDAPLRYRNMVSDYFKKLSENHDKTSE